MVYGEAAEKLVVVEREEGRRWHWRRVSGWMRGWVPSISEGKGGEQEGLLRDGERREGYGAL